MSTPPEFSDWWATVGSRLPHITPEDVACAAWLAAGGGSVRGRDTLPLPPDREGGGCYRCGQVFYPMPENKLCCSCGGDLCRCRERASR